MAKVSLENTVVILIIVIVLVNNIKFKHPKVFLKKKTKRPILRQDTLQKEEQLS